MLDLKNWVPYKLTGNDELNVRWLYVGDHGFSEPFFDDTITQCRNRYLRSFYSESSLTLLQEWADDVVYVKPAAFIFHVSRCGSTTLSQMLAVSSENIVLSEVPFIDDLLRAPFTKNMNTANYETALLATLKFYGQKRNNHEKYLFIKTDSWHICFYEQLRRLFPETPFILLYRSPAEVLRSHQKRRGMQAIPGVIQPEVFGFTQEDITPANLDEYMIKVIEKYFSSFIEVASKDKGVMLVNYNEGMMKILEKIADQTGMIIKPNEHELMQKRTIYHGKYPWEVFNEEPIKEELLPEVSKALKLYEQLEALRTSG
jgi:hypothetical protein